MTPGFCARTEAKIRRLGHPKKEARRYARFFFVGMVAVLGLLGFSVEPLGTEYPDTGTGILPAGLRAGRFVPASPWIHSRP